jgi:hypothetical protein
MEIDPLWLAASFVIGVVGLGLFLFGKRRSRFVPMIAGIVMMVYPYFVSNTVAMIGVGVVIGGFVWYMR